MASVSAASSGTVAYVRGELSTTLSHRFEDTAQAARQALEQLKFTPISQKQDAFVAVFVARTAEDKKVKIKVSSVGETTARVQITVGVFGDESLSLKVLEKVQSNL